MAVLTPVLVRMVPRRLPLFGRIQRVRVPEVRLGDYEITFHGSSSGGSGSCRWDLHWTGTVRESRADLNADSSLRVAIQI